MTWLTSKLRASSARSRERGEEWGEDLNKGLVGQHSCPWQPCVGIPKVGKLISRKVNKRKFIKQACKRGICAAKKLSQSLKMVRELNMDTQRQNFWKESINKEAFVRLSWHARYSKELVRDAIASQKPRKEGLKINALQALKQEMEEKAKKEQESRKKVEEAAKKDPESLLVEMRPVSRDTRELLYDGFSALGGGRYAYLQKRKQKDPEVKYEFPITSAWEVGWKLQDCLSQQKSPSYGRTRVVKDTFYRNNGIFY